MRNKLLKYIFVFFLIGTLSAAFVVDEDNEDCKPKPIEKLWKLICIVCKEKKKISWPQKDHYMEMKKDSIVNVKLDINYCLGKYKIIDSLSVFIDIQGCSITCCDGFTALSLTDAFPDTFRYKLTPDSLELHSSRYSILFKN